MAKHPSSSEHCEICGYHDPFCRIRTFHLRADSGCVECGEPFRGPARNPRLEKAGRVKAANVGPKKAHGPVQIAGPARATATVSARNKLPVWQVRAETGEHRSFPSLSSLRISVQRRELSPEDELIGANGSTQKLGEHDEFRSLFAKRQPPPLPASKLESSKLVREESVLPGQRSHRAQVRRVGSHAGTGAPSNSYVEANEGRASIPAGFFFLVGLSVLFFGVVLLVGSPSPIRSALRGNATVPFLDMRSTKIEGSILERTLGHPAGVRAPLERFRRFAAAMPSHDETRDLPEEVSQEQMLSQSSRTQGSKAPGQDSSRPLGTKDRPLGIKAGAIASGIAGGNTIGQAGASNHNHVPSHRPGTRGGRNQKDAVRNEGGRDDSVPGGAEKGFGGAEEAARWFVQSGYQMLEASDIDHAVAYLSAAHSLDPEAGSAVTGLGFVALRQGKPKSARYRFEEGLRLGDCNARYGVAVLEARKKRQVESVKQRYRRYLRTCPQGRYRKSARAALRSLRRQELARRMDEKKGVAFQ